MPECATDQIGCPNEIRHKGTARRIVDLVGRADLLNRPGMHDNHAIRNGQCLFLVVSHVHRCNPEPVLQLLNLQPHFSAQLGVEIRQRLIEEDHGRGKRKAARQCHTLLLSAGEVRGTALSQVSQTDQLQGPTHFFGDLFPPQVAHPQPIRDVVEHAHVRPDGI